MSQRASYATALVRCARFRSRQPSPHLLRRRQYSTEQFQQPTYQAPSSSTQEPTLASSTASSQAARPRSAASQSMSRFADARLPFARVFVGSLFVFQILSLGWENMRIREVIEAKGEEMNKLEEEVVRLRGDSDAAVGRQVVPGREVVSEPEHERMDGSGESGRRGSWFG